MKDCTSCLYDTVHPINYPCSECSVIDAGDIDMYEDWKEPETIEDRVETIEEKLDLILKKLDEIINK